MSKDTELETFIVYQSYSPDQIQPVKIAVAQSTGQVMATRNTLALSLLEFIEMEVKGFHDIKETAVRASDALSTLRG